MPSSLPCIRIRLPILGHNQLGHGPFLHVVELVGDDGVDAFFHDAEFGDQAAGCGDGVGLQPVQDVVRVAVDVHGVKSGADDVEGADFVGADVVEVDADFVADFGVEGVGEVRMFPVEEDVGGGAVCHVLKIVIFVEFGLDDDEFAVDVGVGGVAVFRFDDDGAVHADGDVHEDGLGAAVVHEHAGGVGLVDEFAFFVGHDVGEVLAGGGVDGVEVHAVGDVGVDVFEFEADGVAFYNAHDGAGDFAVEVPAFVGDPR